MFRKFMAAAIKTNRAIFITLIKRYQMLISPLIGPRCRFYPSCSHYAIEAISKRGVLAGLFLALKRLLRCHPLSPGGYDPTP